jgi:catechol 2,3-dioxygenase-like lactoylglutathione lyase family enzyme
MRLQLAINVADLNASIEFYTRLFGAEPYKVKDGYANWSLNEPPLKFVIFERDDAEPGSINHLGVEVDAADEVVAADARLTDAGLVTTGVDDTICCFAEKVETWVTDPNGQRWEFYVKTADHETQAQNVVLGRHDPCCG